MEYDSFYYNNRIVQLPDALTPDGRDLLPVYNKDALFCPECGAARLKFTRATIYRRSFLSTKQPSLIDGNAHEQDCSHIYDLATKAQVREHYDNLNAGQIHDKLGAAINRLLRGQHRGSGIPQGEENPLVVTPRAEGIQQVSRRLPTKSFYRINTISKENYNVPVLCYGDVYLQTEQHRSDNGGTYYFLWVINRNNREKIRFFYRGGYADHVDENALYHVALIAVFEENPNNSNGFFSNLYDQNSLLFIPA